MTGASSAGGSPSRGLGGRRRDALTPWAMLAPALLLLGGFIVFPALSALYLSLTSSSLLSLHSQTFVGIDNFFSVIESPRFLISLRNSLIWTFGCVAFQVAIGMAGALILRERFRGRSITRAIVLIPWATPSVLVALMWMWILEPNLGIVNRFLEGIGLIGSPITFLAGQHTALASLMFIDIWQGIPFFVVMFLAALMGVPTELTEAAKIDGASGRATFWYVTLPWIMPTVMITVMLRLIWTANYFDLILILTNGGPANQTLTLPLNAYQTAYRIGDLGVAAALGVVQSALLLLLVVVYMRQIRRSEIA